MNLEYLTVDQVKAITHLSHESIRKHIRNGNLIASKCGNRYLIDVNDLKSFIESNKNN